MSSPALAAIDELPPQTSEARSRLHYYAFILRSRCHHLRDVERTAMLQQRLGFEHMSGEYLLNSTIPVDHIRTISSQGYMLAQEADQLSPKLGMGFSGQASQRDSPRHMGKPTTWISLEQSTRLLEFERKFCRLMTLVNDLDIRILGKKKKEDELRKLASSFPETTFARTLNTMGLDSAQESSSGQTLASKKRNIDGDQRTMTLPERPNSKRKVEQ
ncbi:hypothetical protein GQ602_001220 [Ophiocordyceps camponoti-floridani]|uniref:Uncharacterized protein n=1 Tax=Ophiocordyceps camponoti-floridani TaxID=2030778 RepID=A0A8H4QDR6_9HYPO|nr:hypothetical protein GQ602_001220 [Ophiocordyceps camponoti-floridani]